LFFPISQVFNKSWQLRQKIDLFDNVTLDFNAFGLGWLANNMNIDSQIPIGTISIRYYAICILVGVLAGYALSLYLSKWHFIAGTVVDRLLIGLVIFGILGARLFFVLFNLDDYREKPLTIFTEINTGGLAITGMMISSILYIWIYCQRFRFNFYEFLDFLVPGLLLGQVIGRFGNFFNYEAYGPETSVFWKMYVPPSANSYGDLNAKYFHPAFLYEIIPNFLLLVFLLWRYEDWTTKRSGLVFAGYAIGYGIIRSLVEVFRLDALKIQLPPELQFKIGAFGNVDTILVSQIFAILLIIIGIITYFRRSKVIYLKHTMFELSI
jgi:phosphatidylglycerol:prolipoprotein diacylglycerol transferase